MKVEATVKKVKLKDRHSRITYKACECGHIRFRTKEKKGDNLLSVACRKCGNVRDLAAWDKA